MNTYPLVSVVTLIYNTGPFVIEAIKSIRQQTYKNIEHIIIDDASTDDSFSQVEEWIVKHNYKCTLIRHTSNKGMINTLKEVYSLCRGKYIAGLSDDLWIDNEKLWKQVLFMENNQDYGMVHSDYKIFDVKNQIEYDVDCFRPDGFVFDVLIRSNFIGALTTLTRTCLIKEALKKKILDQGFLMEDYPLSLYIARRHKIGYINEITSVYNKRLESVGNTSNSLKQLLFNKSVLDIQTYFATNSDCFFQVKDYLVSRHRYFLRKARENKCPKLSKGSFLFLLKTGSVCFADLKNHINICFSLLSKGFCFSFRWSSIF